jgi:hypothetical protein
MNPFAVLESDDEDETPKVVVAKTVKPAGEAVISIRLSTLQPCF